MDKATAFPEPHPSLSHQALIRLQSVYGSLKKAEKKAADLLLCHPEEVAHGTINDVASLAGCSEATLVRLAKRMAYSGYPEMRSAVLGTRSDAAALYDGIQEQDSPEEVVRKVFLTSVQAVEDSLNILDMQQHAAAVAAIHKADKILFLGCGDASVVALSGFLKFTRLGRNALYYDEFDMQLLAASRLRPGDVVVAVSYSGKTRTLVDIIKYAREHGATVVSITNNPTSPMTKNSDILLMTATFANDMMGEVMTKRIPELCLIESLYISVARLEQPEGAREAYARTSAALAYNKL